MKKITVTFSDVFVAVSGDKNNKGIKNALRLVTTSQCRMYGIESTIFLLFKTEPEVEERISNEALIASGILSDCERVTIYCHVEKNGTVSVKMTGHYKGNKKERTYLAVFCLENGKYYHGLHG